MTSNNSFKYNGLGRAPSHAFRCLGRRGSGVQIAPARLYESPPPKYQRGQYPGELRPLRVLQNRVRICVPLGEPKPFSPNHDSPIVDAIGLPASALASQDIPNSAIHFRAIPFSRSVLGESLVVGPVSPLRHPFARILRFSGEYLHAVNAFRVSVHRLRNRRVG